MQGITGICTLRFVAPTCVNITSGLETTGDDALKSGAFQISHDPHEKRREGRLRQRQWFETGPAKHET